MKISLGNAFAYVSLMTIDLNVLELECPRIQLSTPPNASSNQHLGNDLAFKMS